MAEDCKNEFALFDSADGAITFKNITFDGIKGGAILRSISDNGTTVLENLTVINCVHTQTQGLFRLIGAVTVSDSTFENNTCSAVITKGYDSNTDNDSAFSLTNSVFKNNHCKFIGVVYYSRGGGAVVDGNTFIGNVTETDGNGATLYLGFEKDATVTNNVFENNAFTTTGTSKRCAGALHIGHNATIKNNAFIGNTVAGPNVVANNVCTSTYYDSVDLSGNYWGGEAPVENVDWFDEHKVAGRVVSVDDYLTTYN